MKDFLKLTIYRTGNVLAIAGLAFVGIKLFEYSGEFDTSMINKKNLFSFFTLLIVCGLSNVFLVVAWTNILYNFDRSKNWRLNFEIYGISQIAKYIPGNVFQFVSRHTLGITAGAPKKLYLKSTITELILILSAGSTLSTLLLFQKFEIFSISGISFALLTVLILTISMVMKFFSLSIFYAFLCYLAYLTTLSCVFVITLALTFDSLSLQLSNISVFCSAYVLSWMIGVLTPGAPAGLGIREFVLIMFLTDIVPEHVLLPAVFVSRILSAGSDVIFFIFSTLLKYQK